MKDQSTSLIDRISWNAVSDYLLINLGAFLRVFAILVLEANLDAFIVIGEAHEAVGGRFPPARTFRENHSFYKCRTS